MASNEIDVRNLKIALNAVLDHIIEDLQITTIEIRETQDFYWEIPAGALYDTQQQPSELQNGRLSDDLRFSRLVSRGAAADVSYNLIHFAPLLRYLAERIKS